MNSLESGEVEILSKQLVRLACSKRILIRTKIQPSGLDAQLVLVTPRPTEDYSVDIPGGVPPRPLWDNSTSEPTATVEITLDIDSEEEVQLSNTEHRREVLLRVQPRKVTVTSYGKTLASVDYPKVEWPPALTNIDPAPKPAPNTSPVALTTPKGTGPNRCTAADYYPAPSS